MTLPVTGIKYDPNVLRENECDGKPYQWVAPATRCDAHATVDPSFSLPDNQEKLKNLIETTGIPEGTLFRLPANFDVEQYVQQRDVTPPGMDAATAQERRRVLVMVLKAIRDYGVYVTDNGSTIKLTAESAMPSRTGHPAAGPRVDEPLAWQFPANKGIFWGEGNIVYSVPLDLLQVVAPADWRNW